jgi:uncharacterized protein (DUF58 family)
VSFGSGQRQKRSVAIDFVTVLARLLSRYGNPVGALFYGDRVDTVIPARTGRRHVLHILSRMRSRPERSCAASTDLKDLLQAGRHIMSRRSMVFVVSDFITEPGWKEPLTELARRHEVVAVRLYDPLEMELPDLGLMIFQDAETGEQAWVDTHDRGFRQRFLAAAELRESTLRSALGDAGVDTLELSTADELIEAILRFADLRKRRRQLSAGGGLPPHVGGGHGLHMA